ncbi:MAG TPA: hypothetical protein VGI84_05850 [Pseudonocardiaceae bacterium]
MSDRNTIRRAAFAFGGPIDDPSDHCRRQVVRRIFLPVDENRRVVADSAFELANNAIRIGQRAPLGGVTDDN